MQTFVVSVWEPAEAGDPGGGLRGRVRHVPTGQETTFVDEFALLGFIRAALETRMPRTFGA